MFARTIVLLLVLGMNRRRRLHGAETSGFLVSLSRGYGLVRINASPLQEFYLLYAYGAIPPTTMSSLPVRLHCSGTGIFG